MDYSETMGADSIALDLNGLQIKMVINNSALVARLLSLSSVYANEVTSDIETIYSSSEFVKGDIVFTTTENQQDQIRLICIT